MIRPASAGKSAIHVVLRRAVVIVAYLGLFMLFLYFPLLMEYWSDLQALNVCVFAETFSPQAISRFEQEAGVKVHVTYVEIDDQLHAKFRMNGALGYDVVNISDYVVHSVGSAGQLAALDKQLLPNLHRLEPCLVNLVFDPENQYSVPHKWYVYGMVYDKQAFRLAPEDVSLSFLFEPPAMAVAKGVVSAPYRVCMLDDARDAFFMAAIYLFGRVEGFSAAELHKIRDLLIAQKKWVEAYTLHSAQYFLHAGITPLALMSSNYMRKMYEASDRFTFAIPKEGSMLVVENLAVPATSKKVVLAQRFINFMLRDDIAALNSGTYGFNSANKYANQHVPERLRQNKHLFPDAGMFKRLHIPLLPEHMRKLVDDMWLEVSFS